MARYLFLHPLHASFQYALGFVKGKGGPMQRRAGAKERRFEAMMKLYKPEHDAALEFTKEWDAQKAAEAEGIDNSESEHGDVDNGETREPATEEHATDSPTEVVTPDDVLDPPAETHDADSPTVEQPVIDGTARDLPDQRGSSQPEPAQGDGASTRSEDAAAARRSQIAKKRYDKTQEVFQDHYAAALRQIAGLEGNDPAQARAIARAALRQVRVEGRKQNLAQPLNRDTARLADAVLQISTVGQRTATLGISGRSVSLRRVSVPSVEVQIEKIKQVAAYGLGGDQVDAIGMTRPELLRANRKTPRADGAGLHN